MCGLACPFGVLLSREEVEKDNSLSFFLLVVSQTGVVLGVTALFKEEGVD